MNVSPLAALSVSLLSATVTNPCRLTTSLVVVQLLIPSCGSPEIATVWFDLYNLGLVLIIVPSIALAKSAVKSTEVSDAIEFTIPVWPSGNKILSPSSNWFVNLEPTPTNASKSPEPIYAVPVKETLSSNTKSPPNAFEPPWLAAVWCILLALWSP